MKKNRDLLRFLWFKKLFKEHRVELCTYQFTRVISRANCPQFSLNATIENHNSKYGVLDTEFVKRYEINFMLAISIPVLIL